jgi:murein DD-endopeptidase MepM/ murein hydrolase activator NlpD
MPEIEVDDTPVIAEAPRLIVTPVHGEVLMAFSMEELTYNPTMEDWRTHNGIDIAAASGTTVLAACNGQVLAVEEDALMGTTVVLEHDGGYQTTYANLQVSPPVTAGDFVSAGQIIGAVGSTAAAESAQESHLHFAVTKDGESIDPHTFLDE